MGGGVRVGESEFLGVGKSGRPEVRGESLVFEVQVSPGRKYKYKYKSGRRKVRKSGREYKYK